MIDAEAIIWGLAAAIGTGLGYIQARNVCSPPEGEEVAHGAWLGLTHRVVVSLFGHRYWTVRGLGTTVGLCGAVYGLALLLHWGTMRFGQSGYPTIAVLAFAFLAMLPLLVHVQVQVMGRCLAGSLLIESKWKSTLILTLLSVTPIALTVASLFPVAVVVGMVDSESLFPRSVLPNWLGLCRMLLWDWASPGANGLITLVGLLLNAPALMWWLYLISWGSWFALRRLFGTASAWGTRLEKHPVAAVGVLHASYAFLFVQGILAGLSG